MEAWLFFCEKDKEYFVAEIAASSKEDAINHFTDTLAEEYKVISIKNKEENGITL
jgi:type IV secretory pathway ATPase VirB11/archaellum biosynthesis ATPase